MALESINPTTGQIIKSYEEMTESEVSRIIDEVFEAFQEWKNTSFSIRKDMMKRAGQVLRDNSKKYTELMAMEMGKPLGNGIGEIEKCAWCCDFFADNAEKFLQPEAVASTGRKSFVTFQPLGVVLAIMPWNFPFYQVFRFAAPTLMAGNVGLLKHANNVMGCALAIEEIFKEAGFPKNVFRSLVVGSDLIDATIPSEKIAAVTLTGSTRAGKIVAGIAGSHIKKTVLELGGSDAYVILEDANLEEAVEVCVASRLTNSGQSCIAAKRFIVVEAIRNQFEEKFVEEMKKAKMGDPLADDTWVGPQARYDLRDSLDRQVQESIKNGAKCLLGGKIPDDKGAYYPPTVLTDVKKGMPAYDEELFGPVAAIIPVKNEEEAIYTANDSIYGLGAAVFTRNLEKGEEIAAKKLAAGSCFVNSQVKSDPRLPFGGIKESGYGRELSHYGIREFVNIKSVVIG